jgi:hypothetical protein
MIENTLRHEWALLTTFIIQSIVISRKVTQKVGLMAGTWEALQYEGNNSCTNLLAAVSIT